MSRTLKAPGPEQKGNAAVILQHPRAHVQFDPPDRQTPDSIIYAQAQTIKELQQAIKGLAKPPLHPEPEFHPVESEPAYVKALPPSMAGEVCACGRLVHLHLDTSGSVWIGCEGAQNRAGKGHLAATWPLATLAGDPHLHVTTAIRKALLADCGPAVSCFVGTLGFDELLMFARELSRVAVSAHLAELAR